ncbi:hypothetical protein [Mycoplana dimorpha]|nr:hypothetical protein [Mycoplana dimorpha]
MATSLFGTWTGRNHPHMFEQRVKPYHIGDADFLLMERASRNKKAAMKSF